MDVFYSLRDYVSELRHFVFIIAYAVFFLVGLKNPNVRYLFIVLSAWLVLDFLILRCLIPMLGLSGLANSLIHCVNIALNLLLMKWLYERPFIARSVSRFFHNVAASNFVLAKYVESVFPSHYLARSFQQEVGIIKALKLANIAHVIILLHYLLFAFGVTAKGGVLESMGVERLVFVYVGWGALLIGAALEVVFMATLAVQVAGQQWQRSKARLKEHGNAK